MTITVTEQTVDSPNSARGARVTWEDPVIRVYWTCGDSRSFTPEEALDVVAHARASAEEHPGVWMAARDHYGQPFALMIEGGEMYADVEPRLEALVAPHVPWKSLRRAVRRAAKEHSNSA